MSRFFRKILIFCLFMFNRQRTPNKNKTQYRSKSTPKPTQFWNKQTQIVSVLIFFGLWRLWMNWLYKSVILFMCNMEEPGFGCRFLGQISLDQSLGESHLNTLQGKTKFWFLTSDVSDLVLT